jgi:MFS family permease
MGYGLIHNLNYFFLAAHIAGLGGGIMMTNITTWFLKFTTLKTRVKNAGYFTSSLFLGQFASPIIFFNIAKEMGVQEFLFTLGITLLSITFLLFLAITIVNKFNQTTDKFI